MAAKDTIGSVCMAEELKDDKEWNCACKECEAKEEEKE